MWRDDAAVGEGLAAVHAGPETAVGKAAVGFSAADVAEEFVLGDVAHEADMRGGRVDEPVAVVNAEIAAVPGAAQQRGELPSLTGEARKDGGKFLCEEEEAAIVGRFFVLQSLEDGDSAGAVGGDPAGGPWLVDFGKEGGDLTPACSFSGFAGFADEDDEEIQAMRGGADEGVGGWSGKIAESGEKL